VGLAEAHEGASVERLEDRSHRRSGAGFDRISRSDPAGLGAPGLAQQDGGEGDSDEGVHRWDLRVWDGSGTVRFGSGLESQARRTLVIRRAVARATRRRGSIPGTAPIPTGAPKGPTYSTLLRALLHRREIGGQPLPSGKTVADVLAEVMVAKALQGDYRFIREVLDRTEGKVPPRGVVLRRGTGTVNGPSQLPQGQVGAGWHPRDHDGPPFAVEALQYGPFVATRLRHSISGPTIV
jgi:hypothetical protein